MNKPSLKKQIIIVNARQHGQTLIFETCKKCSDPCEFAFRVPINEIDLLPVQCSLKRFLCSK